MFQYTSNVVTNGRAEVGSTANRYEVLARLASGGMAEIFLARTQSDAGVERYVVLKRVHKHRATDITFVHMFLDEARLAAQLQHPNIAQVYDTGKLGDTYFFTMEYVHGETVRELMHRAYDLQRRVPLAVAVTIVAGAAAALEHAHDRTSLEGKPLQIVHRDVSPSNLMVSYEGHVKILDFGVAKAAHRSVETQSGTVKGKMGYMAPEQCRGREVDRRCDLFSLGIVMWELLVGERLFKRGTDFESMEAIVNEPTPAPSTLRPDVPAALDAITLKLLAKHPRDRYPSAQALLEALEAVAAETGIGISVAAVRRFTGELFGQRPEPWRELRTSGPARDEAVTVTGAPIRERPELLELAGDELDRLRDLSAAPHDPMPPRAAFATAEAAPPASEPETSSGEVVPVRSSRRSWAVAAALVATLGIAVIAVRVIGRRASSAAVPADGRTRAADLAPIAAAIDAPIGAPIDAPIDAPPGPEIVPAPSLEPAHAVELSAGALEQAVRTGGDPPRREGPRRPPKQTETRPLPPPPPPPPRGTCTDPDPMACRQ